MEDVKTRPCPDCHPRNGGEPCDRCQGNRNIQDLGPCGVKEYPRVEAGETIQVPVEQIQGLEPGEKIDMGVPCPFPADREHEGHPLCDGHALVLALAQNRACPTCGGDPSKGMHRGELLGGTGRVKTCGSSQNERDLQKVTNEAIKYADSMASLMEPTKKATEAFEKLGIATAHFEPHYEGGKIVSMDIVASPLLEAIDADPLTDLHAWMEDTLHEALDAMLIGIEADTENKANTWEVRAIGTSSGNQWVKRFLIASDRLASTDVVSAAARLDNDKACTIQLIRWKENRPEIISEEQAQLVEGYEVDDGDSREETLTDSERNPSMGGPRDQK